jgi:hypothetical protein
MQSVLALLGRGKVSLDAASRVLSPKSSLITSGVITYTQACMSIHVKQYGK